MKKVLLHVCCAPCALMPLWQLRAEQWHVDALFSNPNIHPFREWHLRKNTFREYADAQGLCAAVDEEYGLDTFVKRVATDTSRPERCRQCYRMRLEKAAKVAAEQKADAFSTTLLVSPYQHREMICEEGTSAAKQWGVRFLGPDWRPLYDEGRRLARHLGLYLQPYCGCIWSEHERYSQERAKGRR